MNTYSITEECIGCALCAKNCPVGAISGELKGQHVIDEEKCIRCGVCGKFCPKSAILDENGAVQVKVAKAQWKKPEISFDNCVGCSVCIENCPKECLELTRPRFHGDLHTVAALTKPELCIGCSICSKVCPIEAIRMVEPKPSETKPEVAGA